MMRSFLEFLRIVKRDDAKIQEEAVQLIKTKATQINCFNIVTNTEHALVMVKRPWQDFFIGLALITIPIAIILSANLNEN